MSAKSNNMRIGVFVLVAIALLIAGLLAFGAKTYFQKKTVFETAILGEAYGLAVGSPVELRGVPIGKVTRIDFAWNTYRQSAMGAIIVEFEVEANIMPLSKGMSEKEVVQTATTKGLRAVVKSQGITGTSMLALENLNPDDYPPPSVDFAPRYLYIPSAPGQFTRMLEAIEKSLQNLSQLNFASIGVGVSNTLSEVTALGQKLNRLDLQSVSTNADLLLVEIRKTAADLRGTLQAMKLEGVSSNANTLLVGLQDSNARLQVVLDHAGEMPLQQVMSDLRQTLQDLNAVLVELQRYPSGFIFGEPPKTAKSAAAPSENNP